MGICVRALLIFLIWMTNGLIGPTAGSANDPCPGGFTKIPPNCYKKEGKRTKANSVARCTQKHPSAVLVRIANNDMWEAIYNDVLSGGSKDKEFWISGEKTNSGGYAHPGGAPLTWTGLEGDLAKKCVVLQPGVYLETMSCSDEYYFLMEKNAPCGTDGGIEHGGKCFRRSNNKVSHSAAISELGTMIGKSFATIRSYEQAAAVAALLNGESIWVGLSRLPSSAEEFSSYEWASGEPVTWTGMKTNDKNCVYVKIDKTYSSSCDSEYEAICYVPISLLDGSAQATTTTTTTTEAVTIPTTTTTAQIEASEATTTQSAYYCGTGWHVYGSKCYQDKPQVDGNNDNAYSSCESNAITAKPVKIETRQQMDWLIREFDLTTWTYTGLITYYADQWQWRGYNSGGLTYPIAGNDVGDKECGIIKPSQPESLFRVSCSGSYPIICERDAFFRTTTSAYVEQTTTTATTTAAPATSTQEEETSTTTAVQADCDDNWERHGDMCYFHSSDYKTFSNAKNFCNGLQGDLVVIKSEEHVTWLVTEFNLQSDTFTGGKFILSGWKWKWKHTGAELDYPINGGSGGCLVINPNDYEALKKTTCSNSHPFLCEKIVNGLTTVASTTTSFTSIFSTSPSTTTSSTTISSTTTPSTTTSSTTTPSTTTSSTTTSTTTPTTTSSTTSNSTSTTTTQSTTTTASTTTIEVITDENGSILPIVGSWKKWTDCPVKCERSVVNRTRECLTKPVHDPANHMCGNLPLVEFRDCLELAGCDGARYYLADKDYSCSAFCKDIKNLLCSTEMQTGNTVHVFNNSVLLFSDDTGNSKWIHDYGPYCHTVEGKLKCGEYVGVPEEIKCDVKPQDGYQRLCHCIDQGDVGFSPWSPWSQCSQTCEGTATRTRECYGGCSGNSTQTGKCGAEFCPIHGGLSKWSVWESCDRSCGGGISIRSRSCDNPTPAHDGNGCVGDLVKTRDCNVHYCPVDAAWAEWSEWSGCDKPCNLGHTVRMRSCNPPLYGGNEGCDGESIEQIVCNSHPCTEKYIKMTVHFDTLYTPDMNDNTSNGFLNFEGYLNSQVKTMYEDNSIEFASALKNVSVLETKKGSVIATFIIYFNHLDSFQFLFFQDGIEIDESVLKLPVIAGNPITYVIGPDAMTSVPENVESISTSPTSIYVWWTPITNSNLTGYIFFYRKRIDQSSPYHSFGINSTVSSANLTWLEPGVEYAFRIMAHSSTGNGISSNLQYQRTMEKEPSRAPLSVNASSDSPFSVFVEWIGVHQDDMNGIPLGYQIYVILNGTTVAANSTQFDMSSIIMQGLVPSTSYLFKVCAYNSVGNGPCDMATAVTFDSAPSAPPQNAHVDEIKSFDQLTVRWEMPPSNKIHGDLEGYKIIYKPLRTGTQIYMEPLETEHIFHPSLKEHTFRFLTPNTEYSIKLLALNQHGDGVTITLIGETCRCPPLVSSNFYLVPPYLTRKSDGELSGPFGEILSDAVKVACGVCKTNQGDVITVLDKVRNGRNVFAQKGSQLPTVRDIDEFTDLSFPIIGSKMTDEFMGYPFVSLVEHPGVVMIVKDKDITKIVLDMIVMILSVWPLIFINLLMMILAGFLVWLLEGFQSKTDNDFSTKWVTGIKEGWYWAFITQGTHGYGDFAPRKFFSRIFAMIWILVGLVMTSLVIGAIVTALTTVNNAAVAKIYGSECGALNATFEAKLGSLRNGNVNTKQAYTSIGQLKEALLEDDVEIVLLDAYTAGAAAAEFDHPQLRAQELIKYPRTYGFVLSGDLAGVSEEFKDYISVNEEHILSILTNTTEPMQPSPPAEVKSPFDPESVVLQETLIILTIMLVVMAIAGYAFSIWREKRKKATVEPEPQDEEEEEDYEKVKKLTDEFVKQFTCKTEQLINLHEEQRVKLYFDRGQSSLRKNRMRPSQEDLINLLNNKSRSLNKRLSVVSQTTETTESRLSLSPRREDIEANITPAASARVDEPSPTCVGEELNNNRTVNSNNESNNPVADEQGQVECSPVDTFIVDNGDVSDISEEEC